MTHNQNTCRRSLENYISINILTSFKEEVHIILLNECKTASSSKEPSRVVIYGNSNDNKFYLTYNTEDNITQFQANLEVTESRYKEICTLITDKLYTNNKEYSVATTVLFSKLPFLSEFCYKNTFIIEGWLNQYKETYIPHPVILHYKYIKRGNELGSLENNSQCNSLKELVLLISVLTKGYIYYYQENGKLWTLNDELNKSELRQITYTQKQETKDRLDIKTNDPHQTYEHLCISNLNIYYKLKKEDKAQFIKASEWYVLAKNNTVPAVSFLLYVCMVESFFPKNSKYKTKQFTKFLDLYSPAQEKNNLHKEIYNLRGNICHQGKLFSFDSNINPQNAFTPDEHKNRTLYDVFFKISDELLINWLKIKSKTIESVTKMSLNQMYTSSYPRHDIMI